MSDWQPVQFMPLGASRPWHPRYYGTGRVVFLDDELFTGAFDVEMDGPLRKGRVGLRHWLRYVFLRRYR